MECPFCDAPLQETSSISEADQQLISSLPYVIAYPLQRTLNEKHAWTRINLLKDTFLNYLKYLGLLTASEFFNSPLKDKKMVALFHQTLTEPSFGSWNHYIREALKFLSDNDHKFFCPELYAYYASMETGKKRKLYKGEIEVVDGNGDVQLKNQEATAIGMLINFRNRYLGHGLTLDESASQQLFNEYFPIFRTLLEQMKFTENYRMFKHEHGESCVLQSAALRMVEKGEQTAARVWIENTNGQAMDILPFFVVPGELSIGKEDKEQILTYESYTGKTIKFFSPEGTEKQTSGKILERLNLLLRDKQKEQPYLPEDFTKEVFLTRIADENKLIFDTLIAEKKVIPGVYVHRGEMEIKLREWIGARASIFFIAAEAGSGKTNLLVEIQKQYAERNLPCLLIRAGRMEKSTLKQQVAYLLNIDIDKGLGAYPAIAGTQAEPTFILIDGLNEANHAAGLWNEVLEICRCFDPGSLKFIITSRATSKQDIDRYVLPDESPGLVYGENTDNDKGLIAYTHWLTALNMAEMKDAWEGYVLKDKSKYKPKFSFDDLAGFDRALYGQISNPLVLRLFLETYHGKALPGKGSKQLNIWKDWLARFTEQEQVFLTRVADAIWEKGENELLLDVVVKDEILKPWFTTDLVNAPYPRLKNNGWISRYVKDLDACIGFTVEGALLYLLGLKLQGREGGVNTGFALSVLTENNKIRRAALGIFFCRQALQGNLTLVCELIDMGESYHDICIEPLLMYVKQFGTKAAIDVVLANPTENDWSALFALDERMDELQLQTLRKNFLTELMPRNDFKTKRSLWLGLKACAVLEKESVDKYLSCIEISSGLVQEDADLLNASGVLMAKIWRLDKALEFYIKCLYIREKILESDHRALANLYDNIGSVWKDKGEYDKALEFYQICLDIRLKTIGSGHLDVAVSYIKIGIAWYNKGEFGKMLEFNYKCLDIRLRILGGEHPDVATSYNTIGAAWCMKGVYDKALDFFHRCLEIRLKVIGLEHPDVATQYNNIGVAWERKGVSNMALEYYFKCLNIRMKMLSDTHPDVATSQNNIGLVYGSTGEYDKALEFHNKCLDTRLKMLGSYHPEVATSYNNIGLVYKEKREYQIALEFHQKCLDIRLKMLGGEHHDVATSYNNIGSIWFNKEEYDRALEFYHKCLDIYLNTFGSVHPDIAASYFDIGSVWFSKRQYDRALEFYHKCIDIEFIMLGNDHPKISVSYLVIGKCYRALEQYDRALEFFRKGNELSAIGEFPFQMAQCYESVGNQQAALDNFIRSAEIRKEDLDAGPEAASTLDAIVNAKRLAAEMCKENELPEWMKDYD